MKNEGYNVTGITLKLYDDSKSSTDGRQCCAGQDILDAKRVAQKLKINHKILYYQKKFKEDVIDTFVNSYMAGETPIPCVQCNQTVKFRDLYSYAKQLKADALVTGHYVGRIQKRSKDAEMYRAADLTRDQSYFLFSTTQEQLNFLRFPLGKLKKKETRKIASELNLNVADKPDSQDICFVPNGNYASVIKDYKPKSFKEGDILDTQGKVIGKHNGIINFTIGQRKGIGIAHKEPLYVVEIKAKENKIVVGNKSALAIKKIYLKNINLLSKKNNNNFFVKVRSTGRLIKAKAIFNKSECEVNLEENEMGISPGQACVFYSKNKLGYKVLGGGWITKTINKYLST
jgi:tRNA-specific 2-thiouridylase